MRRRATALVAAVMLGIVPLTAAKCSTNSAPATTITAPKGIELHRGGLIYWIGPVPPRPKAGEYWQPRGQTRKGNLIWLRRGQYHTNGKGR